MDTSSEDQQQPARRRIRTLEEKQRILAEADQAGASVATVAREHGLNANVLFAWRRLQRRGLLESQRHAPTLLPVKVTEPTITPTQRAEKSTLSKASGASEGTLEIVFADQTRIRLSGDAQRAVLTRVLEWLPRR